MTNQVNLSPPSYNDEDRRKHLDYIQGIISRLAAGSNSAKGFTLTVASAAFGFSALNEAWYLSLLGIAVVACLSALDMHYLYEERLFRCLFRAVVEGTATNYDMNKDRYKGEATRKDTWMSWSVLGFYLPVLLTGILVVGIALSTDEPASTAAVDRDLRRVAPGPGTATA